MTSIKFSSVQVHRYKVLPGRCRILLIVPVLVDRINMITTLVKYNYKPNHVRRKKAYKYTSTTVSLENPGVYSEFSEIVHKELELRKSNGWSTW